LHSKKILFQKIKCVSNRNNSVSRLFTRIISKGYQTGKSNEK